MNNLSEDYLVSRKFNYLIYLFVTKRPKLGAQMVRPANGLRASSIVWGQIRRPDSTDPDDGHGGSDLNGT